MEPAVVERKHVADRASYRAHALAAALSLRDGVCPITGHVRRCLDAGVLAGDETDIAHVLLGLAQGLAAQETAGWLATSQASADRRWSLAFQATLDGLAAR